MTDFQEEVYIIEKKEITDDEDNDEDFDQLLAEGEESQLNLSQPLDDESDDDLNDFEKLKKKTAHKAAQRAKELGHGDQDEEELDIQPKLIERPVVIDDFIRNFLTKSKMSKTMNIF